MKLPIFQDLVEDHPNIDWVGNWYVCVSILPVKIADYDK